MDASPPRPSKWSDDQFLDTLRDSSDETANTCARNLPRNDALAFLFTKMRTDADVPAVLDPAFRTFLEDARESLDFSTLSQAEHQKLMRGQEVFMTHAMPMSLALLCKSLQEGYQAPRLGRVLMMSGELDSSTYRRVVGVLQMLITVCSPGSFEARLKSDILPASDAALMAVKIRLMHAGLRGIAKRKFVDFSRLHGGQPISMEDMLATLMAFSWLVVQGLETLGITLSKDDADAYHFLWAAYARAMGIHPPGKQSSWEYIPLTLAEAGEFYASYARRHYRSAKENEEGVHLAQANLRMLATKMGFPGAARIYMHRLMGKQASEALGISLKWYDYVTRLVVIPFPAIWVRVWRLIDLNRKDGAKRHMALSKFFLQDLVTIEYKDRIPSYRVPRDVTEIREVVTGTQPGLNFGREQFAREVFPKELERIRERRVGVNRMLNSSANAPAGPEGVADDGVLKLSPLKGPPAADQGLVALSLSGGGIRSATFALGAVQALARQGCLKAVDYLSTVSGGGYTGSTLSSVLNDKEATLGGRDFPLDYETGQIEPPAVRHLRNGSNYLAGGGLLDQLRLPTVLLRGILLNALLVLPYIMFLDIITWLVFPWVHESRLVSFVVFVAVGWFFSLILWYPFVTWIENRKRTWDRRNQGENTLSKALLFAILAVVVAIISGAVLQAVSTNWFVIQERINEELAQPFDVGDLWKWLLIAGLVYGVLRISRIGKTVANPLQRAALILLGLTGPAMMFGTYLLLLAVFARSPFLPTSWNVTYGPDSALVHETLLTSELLDNAAADSAHVITNRTLLAALADRGIGDGDAPDADYHIRVRKLPIPHPDSLGASALSRNIDALSGRDAVGVRRWRLIHRYDNLDRTSLMARLDKWYEGGETVAAYTLVLPDTMKFRDGGGDIHIHGVAFGAQAQDFLFGAFALILFLLNGIWIDVNMTSPHGFWRDRLSRVFLFRAKWFGKPAPNDDLKLSDLGSENPAVPYHILNTSLNLTGSRVEDMPGRGSDFFMFSREYCGSYSTGYATTKKMEDADNHINLGTAMAISSAATAPNAGTQTVRPIVFMMTLLNVRLDYWAPNPWYVQASSYLKRLLANAGRPGPRYLLREALGQLHARGAFVNLSDGGHVENLGIYELLRRRCKVIVCADAEQDPTMSCASLNKLIRYARIDLGIEIDINTDPLNLDEKTNFTERHWTIGTIKYGKARKNDKGEMVGRDETGYLLYVKSSMTGDEAPYVKDYRSRNPAFPQETTADQFFDEAQFESYRALGYHAMNGALKAMMEVDVGDGKHGTPEQLLAIRQALGLNVERTNEQQRAMAESVKAETKAEARA